MDYLFYDIIHQIRAMVRSEYGSRPPIRVCFLFVGGVDEDTIKPFDGSILFFPSLSWVRILTFFLISLLEWPWAPIKKATNASILLVALALLYKFLLYPHEAKVSFSPSMYY